MFSFNFIVENFKYSCCSCKEKSQPSNPSITRFFTFHQKDTYFIYVFCQPFKSLSCINLVDRNISKIYSMWILSARFKSIIHHKYVKVLLLHRNKYSIVYTIFCHTITACDILLCFDVKPRQKNVHAWSLILISWCTLVTIPTSKTVHNLYIEGRW